MNDDIEPAETIMDGIDDAGTTLGGGDIRRDEEILGQVLGTRARSCQDFCASLAKSGDDGFSNAFGSAGDQRPEVFEFQCDAHQRISRDAILSSTSTTV
ncbi:hypothetical protein D9M68_895210 [compost metagenome]